jgi:hypothetical protein
MSDNSGKHGNPLPYFPQRGLFKNSILNVPQSRLNPVPHKITQKEVYRPLKEWIRPGYSEAAMKES